MPAIGNARVRHMRIINLDGDKVSMSEAAHLRLDYDAAPTAGGVTLGRYTFRDLDGDGHPDLVVSYRAEYPEMTGEGVRVEKSEARYLYSPTMDRWAPAPAPLPAARQKNKAKR